ncbi:MAG TPA: 6-phosphogluconolactonase [Silvibacterium sp.]|nr:6-phosphogluconolactonase [Silvibacterium sp.]
MQSPESNQRSRRMTLTYPILNRSRRVLWVVTGGEKTKMLIRLQQGDQSIPSGRVRQDRALVLADRDAAKQIERNSQSEKATSK